MSDHPKISIVYVYPGASKGYRDKALQFVASYLCHLTAISHETIVVCNGDPVSDDTREIFAPLRGVFYLERGEAGWDIGGFQDAADICASDMVVFFGVHTYFRKARWLERMWEVYQALGDTLYGCTGHQGALPGVHPHVRTTAFWCHPSLMRKYPYRVSQCGSGGQRYEFEHGASCLSNWVRNEGMQPWIVGMDAVAPLQQCDSLPGGYHQGAQENLLVGDRLTAPPFHGHP